MARLRNTGRSPEPDTPQSPSRYLEKALEIVISRYDTDLLLHHSAHQNYLDNRSQALNALDALTALANKTSASEEGTAEDLEKSFQELERELEDAKANYHEVEEAATKVRKELIRRKKALEKRRKQKDGIETALKMEQEIAVLSDP